MVIGVCGFSSTGSSAVSDLLKEFDETCVLDDHEFTLPYYPDGLNDLSYHLNENISKYTSSNVAIERFRRFIDVMYKKSLNKDTDGKLFKLTEEFLNNIVQVRWNGYGGVDIVLFQNYIRRYLGSSLMQQRIIPRLEKIFNKNINCYPVRRMEYSIKPDNFEKLCREYIEEILKAMGSIPEKTTVLNQPFPGNDPESSFRYFKNPKAIVVDRDPRDVYVFAKKFLLHKGRMIPTERVEDFVIYHRNMRKNMPYLEENKRILNINFEDLVYEYDVTIQKVIDFCQLEKHSHPKSIFVPEMSINNTQVFKRYPEYAKDIQYIEDNLPEFLFPFENYTNTNVSGEMFSGRSPLNR